MEDTQTHKDMNWMEKNIYPPIRGSLQTAHHPLGKRQSHRPFPRCDECLRSLTLLDDIWDKTLPCGRYLEFHCCESRDSRQFTPENRYVGRAWLRILCPREGGFKRVKAVHALRAGHAVCIRVVPLPLKRVPAGSFKYTREGGNWSRPPVCYTL